MINWSKVFITLLAVLSCFSCVPPTYTGSFGCISGDCNNGQGTYTYPGGSKYVGEWKDNKRNGQGTYAYPGGNKYVGEFKDDNYHGQGTYTWANGNKYVGEFKDDKQNGKGVLFKVNGVIQSGIFVNDKFKDVWTIEAVENFLKNNYPQFEGFDYEPTTISLSSQENDITSITPSENPVFIAVLDFDGKGVTNDEASALSDRLRLELFSTKRFTVIERAMMEQILVEQGFQQSGCTTNECIVEVGRLIGVEQIAGGSISKVGRTYSVSARIVSVETGKILKTATYDYRGEIDDLLVSGMRKIAVQLAK